MLIIEEYRDLLPITGRQILYRMIGRFGYPKDKSFEAKLYECMNRGRRAGLIPFEAMRDDGVSRDDPVAWDDVADFISYTGRLASQFKLDRQTGQPTRIFIMAEAAGMVPMIARVAGDYGVSVLSSGGFDSLSAKHSFAEELCGYGQCEVLHLGDHDPSGVHLFYALTEDIQALCIGMDERPPTFTRLAVTPAQIEAMNLPKAPAKVTDNRSFTGGTVQCEAIPPDVLARIVLEAILSRQDDAVRGEVLYREAECRAHLLEILEGAA